MRLSIEEDWTGYVINHLRNENDPYHREGDHFPDTSDWRLITRNVTLQARPVYANFLLVAKIGVLTADPDTLEAFPEGDEIPVYEEKYDYGTWGNKLPQKQDKIAHFFVGTYNPDTKLYDLTLDTRDRLITRHKSVEDLEEIVVRQRKKAASYLKARAKQLGLGQQVLDFFSDTDFTTAELQYVESGSTAIIDLVTNSTATWLDIPVPDDPNDYTIRDQIILQFNTAQIVPDQTTIDSAIAAAY